MMRRSMRACVMAGADAAMTGGGAELGVRGPTGRFILPMNSPSASCTACAASCSAWTLSCTSASSGSTSWTG